MNAILSLIDPNLFTATSSVFTIQSAAFFSSAFVLIYLIFYTTKDVIIRSNSFVFMLFSLLLVTVLPIVGFALYMLIRPPHTKLQRSVVQQLQSLQQEVLALKHKPVIVKKAVSTSAKKHSRKKPSSKKTVSKK